MLGSGKLACRRIDIARLEDEIADLRVMPGERFRILCAGCFRRHAHADDRRVEMALQLLGIRDPRVRRRIGPQTSHGVKSGERFVVLTEFEVRVAGDPVIPRVVGMHAHRS